MHGMALGASELSGRIDEYQQCSEVGHSISLDVHLMCSNILCERVPFACVLWLWLANIFWCGSELPQKKACNANDKIKTTRPFISSCCCRRHHHRSRHVSRGVKVRACKAGPIRSGRIVPGLKGRR